MEQVKEYKQAVPKRTDHEHKTLSEFIRMLRLEERGEAKSLLSLVEGTCRRMRPTATPAEVASMTTAIYAAANDDARKVRKVLHHWEKTGRARTGVPAYENFRQLLIDDAENAVRITEPSADEYHSAVAGAPKGKGNAPSESSPD